MICRSLRRLKIGTPGTAAKAVQRSCPKKKRPNPQKKMPLGREAEDVEVPLESLAEDELRFVAEQYIDGRAESLNNELAAVPENSPDELRR